MFAPILDGREGNWRKKKSVMRGSDVKVEIAEKTKIWKRKEITQLDIDRNEMLT